MHLFQTTNFKTFSDFLHKITYISGNNLSFFYQKHIYHKKWLFLHFISKFWTVFGLKLEDIEFLKTIMKEHLLLAALAARNINSNYEDCWFLVFTSNSKKKKGENFRILVTLQELEKKIAGCV